MFSKCTKREEVWKPVPGYEGFYEASNLGRIQAIRRRIVDTNGHERVRCQKVLAGGVDHDGYKRMIMCKYGIRQCLKVSVMVAATFLGPRPAGCHVCHNDGNPLNDRADNLRYDTPKGNAADTIKHGTSGRGEKNGRAIVSENDVIEIRRSSDFQRVLAARYGIGQTVISKIKRRKLWRHVA